MVMVVTLLSLEVQISRHIQLTDQVGRRVRFQVRRLGIPLHTGTADMLL
jgi:hypothetical protein